MDSNTTGLIIFGIVILFVVSLVFLRSGGNRSRNTAPRVIVTAPPVTPPAAPPAIPMSLRNSNNATNSGVDMDEALALGCEVTEDITPYSYHRHIKQPKYHAPVNNFIDNRVVYNQAAGGNQHQPNQGGGGNQNQNQPNQNRNQNPPNNGGNGGNQNQPNQGGGGNQGGNQGNRRGGQQGQGGNGP